MRVLIVSEDFPSELDHVRGIFILRQVLALRELGHDISILRVVPLAPPIGARWHKYRALGGGYTYAGIRVTVARTLVLPGLRNFEHLRAQTGSLMRRAIARFQPDIVHAQYLQYAGSIAAGRGRPTVITAHGIDAYDWPFRREGLRRDAVRTLRLAETVVGVSGFIADTLRRLVERPIEVVFNGADVKTFGSPDRARARAALGIPQERAALAFVGHLIPDKGIFELAAALRQLQNPPLLLIAGDGTSSQAFADALREGGVEARFFGYVSSEKTAQILAAADAATLPSWYEGLPVSVCEAMLSARPVIATRVGGIPEIIRHGETGFLTDAKDVDGLSRLYAHVFGNLEEAARIGERAHEFASESLTWEANARCYDRMYRSLVAARAA